MNFMNCSIMANIKSIMGGALFYELAGCATYVAISLFAIDRSLQNINLNTLINIYCLLTSLVFNFFICSYSEDLTQRSLDVADIIYDSNWYRLQYKQQKLLIMSIQRSQRIFRLKGFQIVDCSMEIFLKVRLNSFSLLTN